MFFDQGLNTSRVCSILYWNQCIEMTEPFTLVYFANMFNMIVNYVINT